MRKIVIVALAIALVGGCDLFGPREVRYSVTASDQVFITARTEGGSTEQFTVANPPWTKEFTVEPGDFLYVSAQVYASEAWVRTKIRVNGELLDSAYSTGDFVIATSSGRAE